MRVRETQLGNLLRSLKWPKKTSKHHCVYLYYPSIAQGLRHHLGMMFSVYGQNFDSIEFSKDSGSG